MIKTDNGKVYAPYIQGKGSNQNARFARGSKQGWLTESEQGQLKDARAADLATLNAAKSDGVVDRSERQEVRQDMRNTSRELTEFLWNSEVS